MPMAASRDSTRRSPLCLSTQRAPDRMNHWFGAPYFRFAQTLLEQRSEDAFRAFDVAEAHGADPDRCGCGRWMSHMLAGNLEAAWRESDAIRKRGTPDPHRM